MIVTDLHRKKRLFVKTKRQSMYFLWIIFKTTQRQCNFLPTFFHRFWCWSN
jgi:hypothetical protein